MGMVGSMLASAAASELASGNGGGILVNRAQSAAQKGEQTAEVNAQQAAQMQTASQNTGRNSFAQNFYQGMATNNPVVQYAPDGKSVDWGDTLIRAGGRYAQRNLLDGISIEDGKNKMADIFAASK